MVSISATVITRNESQKIERALRSLSIADEVLVVDCASTDGTQELASRLGARVIEHPWEGYTAQKNFAAAQARHDWILSLDADEELSLHAQRALLAWKNSEPQAVGYRIARRAQYLGRWIRHSGWYPDWKLRLYDRRRGHWVGGYVHESLEVEGPIENLAGEILHYTCDSVREHLERLDYYTGLAAQELFEQRHRSTFMRRAVVPFWTFWNTYLLKLGILDGYQGLLIAIMAAYYTHEKYAKLAALERARSGA